MQLRYSGFLFSVILIFATTAAAQSNVSPFAGYTPGQALQGSPGGAIAISGFETFNPANSQLSINIPLKTVQGRGSVSVPMVIPLTNPVWETSAVQYQYNCGQTGCTTGYGYIVQTTDWNPLPSLIGQAGSMVMRGSGDTCTSGAWHLTLTRGTFTWPDGTQTEFIDQATNGTAESQGYNRGTAFIADDGSNTTFASSAAISDPTSCNSSNATPSGTMTLRNGTIYTIGNGLVTQIEDSNGNVTGLSSTVITDNLGRTYTTGVGSDSNGNYEQVQYNGAGGAGRSIQIRYGSLGSYLVSGSPMTYAQLWPSVPSPPTNNGPTNLSTTFNPNNIISAVDLPDGSSYTFLYDAYGDLAQITLPTGGVIQYSYVSLVNTVNESGITTMVMARQPTQRNELLSGNVVSEMKFAGGGEIDRYDGSGNLVAKETHAVANTGTLPTYATNYNSWQYNQSTTDTYYDSAANGGGALKTVATSYFQATNCTVNCTSAQKVTTTVGSNVKQSAFVYDQYGNATDEKDSDFGSNTPGPVLRETQTSYMGSPYTGSNMVSLPSVVSILDGGSNLYAQTEFTYDGGSLTNTSGIVGHDSARGTGFTTRGNVTNPAQCMNPPSCTSRISHTRTFDIAGNALTAQDGDSQTTTYSYNDDGSNHYSFATKVTNALGQAATFSYDYNIGQPATATDLNNIQTSYTYNDGLDRPTQIVHGNGSAAQSDSTYAYPSTTWFVQRQDQVTANDQELISQQYTDGFGRMTESSVIENPNNWGQYSGTDITYNALGLAATTDTPSRTGNQSGYPQLGTYVTNNSYDGLGRLTKKSFPDGAVATSSYAGNQTTVRDEALKNKIITYDGLGRIWQVLEDSGNLNIAATYGWDPLGNLTKVTQGSQTRTFSYDAVSRLMSSTQPESGTTSYTYDAASNLKTVTDARGTVKTYNYDTLNRPLSITYSDGTPTVSFTYDNGAAGTNTNNTRGRLLSVSNSRSTTNYSSYDALGRVTGSSQVTGGQTYGFTYTYNRAGALLTETNAYGRSLTTAYDMANRPTTLSGTLSGATTNYITSTIYWPNNMPYYYVRGGNNNVWHANAINSRMQVPESYESLNNSENALLFVSCPNWGVNPNNYGLYDLCPHSSNTNDNGILQGYQEMQGGSGYPAFGTFTQTLTYDGLNRLTSATDTSGSTTNWARTFNYDTWGNMWVSNVTGQLAGNTPTSNVYSGTTNRDNRWTYDAAGNLFSVNGNTAAYNAENEITGVTGSGITESINYDGLGQRVQKTVGGTTTTYVYDAFGLAEEYVGGSWSRDYIFDGGGNLYATENSSGPCATCFFGFDHLGSVRFVMDGYSNVIARHDYLSFGEEANASSGRTTTGFGVNDNVTEKFTGQVRDSETGQDFFNARYFTPVLGRFNSADPANAGASLYSSQSWNGYGYVLGNPLSLVDPSGEHWEVTGTCISYTLSSGNSPCAYNWKWVEDGPTVIDIGPSSQGGGDGSGGGGGGGRSSPAPAKNGMPNYCAYQGTALSPQQYAVQGKSFATGIAALSQSYAPDVAFSFGLGTLYGQFSKGSILDAQPRATGTPLQRASYGNYAFGAFFAGAGVPLSDALTAANTYGFKQQALGGAYQGRNMDRTYTHLPAVNAQDIVNGYNAALGGTMCHR